ncbi:MAG: OB-fold nucleic acid binding domain-containing protein, partial [Nitriliruptorales bacterium]
IRFGLAAVRNVGVNVVDAIVRARKAVSSKTGGAFTDFYDFLRKVDAVACNKRTIESLIKAGAFDSLGHTRKGLLSVHADAIDSFMDVKRNEAIGQFDLFGFGGAEETAVIANPPIPDSEWDKTDLLVFEREMLGLYVSDHPLFGTERLLARLTDIQIGDLRDQLATGERGHEPVTVGGVLMEVGKRFTKKGETYATATLEDLSSGVEVIFFPKVYREAYELLEEDQVVVVRARVDYRDESLKLIASEVFAPDLSDVRGLPLVLRLDVRQCTTPMVEELKTILSRHRGHVPVQLELVGPERTTVFRLGDDFRVSRRPGLFGELKSRFGPDAVAERAAVAAT